MKAKLEYRALVSVDVDLETGEVESVTVRAATDDDERVDLSVSIDSDEEQPDEVYERGQQIVDAAAPFELSGWWAPSPEQRWTPVVKDAENDELEGEVEEAPVRLRKPPAKEIGTPPPYALPYQDDLPALHREALRRAAGSSTSTSATVRSLSSAPGKATRIAPSAGTSPGRNPVAAAKSTIGP